MTDDSGRLATLQRLFTAFNAHDGDGVMACFTPSAVFLTAAGPEAGGRRIVGLESIRVAFVAVRTNMPDVQWTVHRSRVLDGEGITEWLFTGTRTDGARVEAEGLDLLGSDGVQVASTSAFRKDRSNLPARTA